MIRIKMSYKNRAATRAKSRALSDVTGVGAVALEEMKGVDNAE